MADPLVTLWASRKGLLPPWGGRSHPQRRHRSQTYYSGKAAYAHWLRAVEAGMIDDPRGGDW